MKKRENDKDIIVKIDEDQDFMQIDKNLTSE